MAGHKPRPTFRPGETADRFLRRIQDWQATSATTRKLGPALPPPGGAGGGHAPVPFAQTQAGLLFDFQQQQKLLAQQQTNALELDRRRQAAESTRQAEQLAREREKAISQLQIDRQTTFARLKVEDPVRATLFALGYGPENDTFDVRAQGLGTTMAELKGAREFQTTQQSALSRITGRSVTIGAEGVQGLGSAVQSARSFVQGGADIQSLLTSAFGVGSLRAGEQPGLSAARLQELIAQVVPTGVL